MEHEIVVEGFVLQVEVVRCVDEPPRPDTWSSDWDFYGGRELEFSVLSGITYHDDGVRMDVLPYDCYLIQEQYAQAIETALWVEIDAQKRRQRWAA